MTAAIPPHRALALPGIHGYTDVKTVRAGETVALHLSVDRACRLAVFRLGEDPEDRASDHLVADLGVVQPNVQPIHPGSYVHVPRGLPARIALPGLTLECWVMPWRVDGPRQALVTQWDGPASGGFGLFIEADGALGLNLADAGGMTALGWTAGRLRGRAWQHVAATWDGRVSALWIDGVCVGRQAWAGPLRPGAAPLRLGACGEAGVAQAFADVDLALPAIHECALPAEALARRAAERGRKLPAHPALRACWPLREGRGGTVADASGHQRDGRIVNHGTWMIRGPGFDEAAAAADGDPFVTAGQCQGLRLAADDLYDCRWGATHHVTLPVDARPGLHVARLRFELDGREAVYDITFLVRRAADAPPAPLLVLCAMSSWLAYAATPFARNTVDDPVWPRRSTGLPNSHPDAPAYCSYTFHRAGQPSYFTGLRMPWPNASPAALYDPAGSGFAQWTRLERRLHVWLEKEGYDFDLLADLDVHRDPALLARYRTVVVNGHSEYWSTPVVDAFDALLRRGGCALVLSGNTMYLRVSFDEDMAVMEQRKTEDRGADPAQAALRPPAGPFGEEFHSQDWMRGGQLRAVGRSAASIIGLETAGWGFADAGDFGVYHVAAAQHPFFRHPWPVGLAEGDTFGHAPGGGLPRAIGHEWDLTVASLRRMTHGPVPEGAALPDTPAGLQVIAQGRRRVPGALDTYLDWFSRPTEPLDGGLSAEMIDWQRPQGGRVFHAGAVGAAWVVGHDPAFDALLRNVLHHFGVPAPMRHRLRQAD
ncbi:N,N-dimethylformamidase beta subunit family domain-containing protein [uncultured Pseudacidovorax sp.]|uniref:N,N-dimethylformamidase beta subunit family domain-containing protein n=1 Tax=uncultured Pseudacidovorax sp. TaxID=679313 RepID=UPI0025DDFB2A|nr:N,N-dimethylformamidase beta subunit family domain-containing protein [uncultured Pseudacidovorax sp.]